jgi:hypothetical protein
MGMKNIITPQQRHEDSNLVLFLEKGRNASPTIPYILVKVPSIIKKAAQKSFFCPIRWYVKMMMAAIPTLNCCEARELNSSMMQKR